MNNMENKEINIKIKECNVILKKLAHKFTNNPEDIQDLVQETLMKSVKYLDQYIQNPKVISWLYVIMKNVYINQFRRHKQKLDFEVYQLNEYYQIGLLEPSIANPVEGTFMMNDILKLLNKFPAQQKEMFFKFVDGYKYKELSEHFDIPEGTIKSRIHFIRKDLRRKLVKIRFD